jgi:hypothetical protein
VTGPVTPPRPVAVVTTTLPQPRAVTVTPPRSAAIGVPWPQTRVLHHDATAPGRPAVIALPARPQAPGRGRVRLPSYPGSGWRLPARQLRQAASA